MCGRDNTKNSTYSSTVVVLYMERSKAFKLVYRCVVLFSQHLGTLRLMIVGVQIISKEYWKKLNFYCFPKDHNL